MKTLEELDLICEEITGKIVIGGQWKRTKDLGKSFTITLELTNSTTGK